MNPNLSEESFSKHPERINLKGRPKKWITTLKERGYTKGQVNDTIQVMLNLSLEELKDIYENHDTNILEKTVAHALKKSLEKGSLYSIETLLTRVYGQPKQEIEQQIKGDIKITLNLNGDIPTNPAE